MEFDYIGGMFFDVARIAAYGVEGPDTVKVILAGGAAVLLHAKSAEELMEAIKCALTKRGAVFLA